MGDRWESRLGSWRQAGLIEPTTAEAIPAWELAQPSPQRLRVTVLVAIALGGVLVAAGLLLFVSTPWEALAPGQRFGLLLALVVGLHGVGTVTLGEGIFLAGQLFHLEAHWPWGLLRRWPQLALLALVIPGWLVSEWQLAVAIGWLLPGVAMAWGTHQEIGVFTHLWWAVGGLLLVAWGVLEGRSERVNVGAALIDLDMLAFYVSQLMDSQGRSASLIGLGVLFLGGGWGQEVLRRRFVARALGRGIP